MTKTLRPLLFLLVTALPALALARGGTPIDESRPAQRGGSVSITNIAGSVTVSHWNRSEIQVTGELGKGSERLHFEVKGKRAEIEVVLPDNETNKVKGSDLIVRVPEGSELDVNVVSADVSLTVDADVELNAVSGDVRIVGEARHVDVNCVSGEVEVLLSGRLEKARINNVSGDITLASRLTDDGRIDVNTVSGDIDLGLEPGLDAHFSVQTFSGRLGNKMTSDRFEDSGYGPGSSLSFSTGGRARVKVQTFSGDILLDPTDRFDWN